MSEQNRTTLKTYFNTGDRPTETQFANFIDSAYNKVDDAALIQPGYVTLTATEIDPPPLSGAPYEATPNCALGTRFRLVVDNPTNINEPTNPVSGQIYTFVFVQGASDTGDIVFPRGFRVPDFAMASGVDNISTLVCIYDSATSTMLQLATYQLT